MLGRSEKGNIVKSLPVKRKEENHANLHDIDKDIIQTYKRRKNTKVHDFTNDRTINIDLKALELVIEEKHVMSIMQPDAGMRHQRVCLSEGNILYTTNNMDSDEIIQKNNGVYQNPRSSRMLEDVLIKGEDHVLPKVINLDFFFIPCHENLLCII
jgi:hypothetical protein